MRPTNNEDVSSIYPPPHQSPSDREPDRSRRPERGVPPRTPPVRPHPASRAVPTIEVRDVEATGQWGAAASRTERLGVALVCVVVVLAVATTLVTLRGGTHSDTGNHHNNNNAVSTDGLTPTSNNNNNNNMDTNGDESTDAGLDWDGTLPTNNHNNNHINIGTAMDQDDGQSPNERYQTLLDTVRTLAPAAVATRLLRNMTQTVDDLMPGVDAYSSAAYWLFRNDTANDTANSVHHRASERLLRFALAALYFAHGGATWRRSGQWLDTSVSVCDWEGVRCRVNPYVPSLSLADAKDGTKTNQPEQVLSELDLSVNQVTGPVPIVGSLWRECRSVLLNDNALTGTIPGEAWGAMPRLSYLYLQTNQLTGTIPTSLKASGTLDTLFLHGNKLTGSWPLEFCPTSVDDQPFRQFGINCQDVECVCCSDVLNCFA